MIRCNIERYGGTAHFSLGDTEPKSRVFFFGARESALVAPQGSFNRCHCESASPHMQVDLKTDCCFPPPQLNTVPISGDHGLHAVLGQENIPPTISAVGRVRSFSVGSPSSL